MLGVEASHPGTHAAGSTREPLRLDPIGTMKTNAIRANPAVLRRRITALLWLFIAGLALSGATAIPLETEVRLLSAWVPGDSGFGRWVLTVRDALIETNHRYPFLAYGTDWLAFGHFMIALVFLGPLRAPVRNVWVIEFGMWACGLVIPFAFVMGGIRGIPWGWRLIDCSFGVFGIVPLYYCRQWTRQLAACLPQAGRDGTLTCS